MAREELPVEGEGDTPPTGLAKEQKIGFVLLLIFAIITISLGFLQIRNTLYRPFALNDKVPISIKDEVTTIDSLRFRDVDHDTLSDYDELYTFGTSPYLADTDSDGASDAVEQGRGTNPLCPEGKDCSGLIGNSTAIVSSTTILSAEAVLGPAPTDLNDLLTNAAQLRQLLIEGGVDPKVVAQVSDADLLQLVNEVIKTNTTTMAQLELLNTINQKSTTTVR